MIIIQNNSPSEQTISEAANIACYFLSLNFQLLVPVDVVRSLKKIKKPNGAKTQVFCYFMKGNRTVFLVTPD